MSSFLFHDNGIGLASQIRADMIATGSAGNYLPGTFDGAFKALEEAEEYYLGEFTYDANLCHVPEVLLFDRRKLPSARPLFHFCVIVQGQHNQQKYQSALLVLRSSYRILLSHFIREKHWRLNPTIGISDRGCPLELHFMMADERCTKQQKMGFAAMLAQSMIAYNALTNNTPTNWFMDTNGITN